MGTAMGAFSMHSEHRPGRYCRAASRVTTGSGKSWKVMGFRMTKFQAWIVMENNIGHGKSWKGHGKAMER